MNTRDQVEVFNHFVSPNLSPDLAAILVRALAYKRACADFAREITNEDEAVAVDSRRDDTALASAADVPTLLALIAAHEGSLAEACNKARAEGLREAAGMVDGDSDSDLAHALARRLCDRAAALDAGGAR